MKKLIHLSVFGSLKKCRVRKAGAWINASTPLDLAHSAKLLGVRWQAVLAWRRDPEFERLMMEALRLRIGIEEIENLRVARQIRDDPATLPRDRLTAIAAIRSSVPAKSRAGVQVNILQQNSNSAEKAEFAAGYVVYLAEDANEPPPPTINGTAELAGSREGFEASRAQRALRAERANRSANS